MRKQGRKEESRKGKGEKSREESIGGGGEVGQATPKCALDLKKKKIQCL